MIVFPSAESATSFRSPPWIGLALSVLGGLCYLVVHLPMWEDYRVRQEAANQAFLAALNLQHAGGNLKDDPWILAQEEPAVVVMRNNRDIYSPEVQDAFRNLDAVPLPLEILERGSPLRKMLLLLTPHHLGIYLLGAICLLVMCYLLEHQYDRLLPLVFFSLSAALWILLEPFMPPDWWPSPIFAWSHSVGVLLLVAWLSAPRATITLTLRTWFGRFIQFKPELPGIFFPAFYLAVLLFVNFRETVYRDHFSWSLALVLPIEAVLFAIPLLFLSRRGQKEDTDGEDYINRRLASVETLFQEERHAEALDALRDILDHASTIDQRRRIADLAWRHHHGDLAEEAYRDVLKETFRGQDFMRILTTAEEMLFRDISVPGPALLSVVKSGIKHRELDRVRKMLPYLRAHPDIEKDAVLHVHENLVERLCAQATPKKDVLLEIKAWLETHAPRAGALEKINGYLEVHADQQVDVVGLHRKRQIHKQVTIELLDINNTHVRLRIQGGKEQQAPWTAVSGIYGCHLATGKRGYRGCLLLRYNRKIFAGNFTGDGILILDKFQKPLSFEKVWDLLETNMPEDLPFVAMRDFEDIADEDRYPKHIQAFMDRYHL